MRYRIFGRLGAMAALAAFAASPAFAQHTWGTAGAAAPNVVGGFALQQEQINNRQEMYNQGQLAIQGSTLAHMQSQQTLSTLSERNQAQLEAQTPRVPSSPTTTGTLHF
jgi:hypothetical protein